MQGKNCLAQCEQFKEKGNVALKAHHFEDAINNYTEALNVALKQGSGVPNDKAAIYFGNRAQAHIKMENYGLAINDAKASLEKNPNYQKSLQRLGFCSQLTQHYKDAYTAYKKLFQLSGNKNEDYHAKLIEIKRMSDAKIKNQKLELLKDDRQRGPKVPKPYKNWRQIEIQPQYTGPQLKQDQEITSEWVVNMMEHFKNQKNLHKRFTLQLIEKCKNIVSEYKALVDYQIHDDEEINVCGDIHGQYYDVLNLFKLNGNPSENNKYLFNGDFVDRGSFSVQCIMTLIAWKCVNSSILHMTRGNHEAKQVNMIYGFKGQVQAKYKDVGVYQAFSQFFCALPIAYVINKKVLICHGGLPSQDDVTLQQIRGVNRFCEPPQSGIMCDLLWADPAPQNGRAPSKRGVSMGFGPDITQKFLEKNNLSLVIRSHQVKQEGYEVAHNGKCITIFSAPNYCDFTGNKAAWIKLKGNQLKPKFTQFDAVPHPNKGPMAYARQFGGMF